MQKKLREIPKYRPHTTTQQAAIQRDWRCFWHSMVFRPLQCHNFRYCVTLFSKCFSSFVRTTCALSVYPSIFSLGRGIPAIFALQSQTVLLFAKRFVTVAVLVVGATGLEPAVAAYFKALTPTTLPSTKLLVLQLCHLRLHSDGRFGYGLCVIPVRSPLLGESLLFSFPAPNDMLKFGA